jgi:hypothetical protein
VIIVAFPTKSMQQTSEKEKQEVKKWQQSRFYFI